MARNHETLSVNTALYASAALPHMCDRPVSIFVCGLAFLGLKGPWHVTRTGEVNRENDGNTLSNLIAKLGLYGLIGRTIPFSG